MENYRSYLTHPVFGIVSELVTRNGQQAYVIGGFVRDLLLGGSTAGVTDIDIVVTGSGIDLAGAVRRNLGKGASLSVFKNFGTAMVKWKDAEIEFVGARKESYRSSSRKPIVENGSLEDDQRRRDFTINALAISLHQQDYGTLVDPFDGLKDLENKIMRTPLDPVKTFSDDPLRMLRGIRFAARLGFRIEPGTFEAIQSMRERIQIVSQERITGEINKIMMTDRPGDGFRLLDESGLLAIIMPEIEAMKGVEKRDGFHHKDNLQHTLEVVDNVAAQDGNLWLRWAALLHDVAKPATKKFEEGVGWTFHAHDYIGYKMIPGIFRRMKLPMNEKMKYVRKLVRLHLRPIGLSQDGVTDSAVRRLLFDAGDEIDDLMLLCEADITSKNERTVKRHLKNFEIVRKKLVEIEEKDHVRNFQPPVTGNDIQKAFGIPPGREIGIIKSVIKEAILEGEISNDFQEAYHLMVEKGKELGLEVVHPLTASGE